MQEAICHVEGSAAPHLQGEAIAEDLGRCAGTLNHVAGTDTSGQQALMGVTQGRVGNQQLLLIHHPLAQGHRAILVQELLQARLGIARRHFGEAGVSYSFLPAVGSLTTILPMYSSILLARFWEGVMENSSGVSSMNLV